MHCKLQMHHPESFHHSLLLVVQQFDSWGIFQKLFFNESIRGGPEGVLRLLGWVHLYTASGIHIYALLEGVEWLIRKIHLKNNKYLPLIQISIRLLIFLMLAFLWSMQGFRFGFLRPLLMFGLRQWGKSMGLKWNLLAPLLITFCVDYGLTLSDSNISTGGRIHYYLAVGGGILALELGRDFLRRKSSYSLFMTHLLLAVGSWVWIAVMELVTDHHVALWTPLWSLLTLPLICGLVYPLMVLLLGFYVFFGIHWIIPFGKLCTMVLGYMIMLMDHFNLTFFVIQEKVIFIAAFCSVLFTVIIYLFKTQQGRFQIIVLSIVLAFCGRVFLAQPLFARSTSVTQLDVGQGDALLAINASLTGVSRTEMIDVGPIRGVRPENLMIKLARHGVSRIDGILLTHLDEDHQGALHYLSILVPIDCIETHLKLWRSEKGKKISTQALRAQKNIQIISSNASCLQLIEHVWIGSGKHGKGNELMAGSLIELNSEQVYLAAGDADEGQEKLFYEHFKEKIKSYPHRIWKVGHHGSKFSSDIETLIKIAPEEVWISVGRRNSYHHPHPTTLFKLSSIGIPYRRTDEEGDIGAGVPVKSKIAQPFFSKISL